MSINERIKILIDQYEGGTVLKFAKKIGVPHTSVAGMLPRSRESKPGFEIIAKILDAYPEVLAEWFIRGEGPMLKTEANPYEKSVKDLPSVAENQLDYNISTQLAMCRKDIAHLKEKLEMKEELIAEKDARIKRLEKDLTSLENGSPITKRETIKPDTLKA